MDAFRSSICRIYIFMLNFLKKTIQQYIGTCSTVIQTKVKGNLFHKLIANNSGYSVKNFFVLATTLLAILLLIPIPIILLIEGWYNHTIASDFGGMAAYITSIAGLMASAGITKAWSEWSENKYGKTDGTSCLPDGPRGPYGKADDRSQGPCQDNKEDEMICD